MKKIRLDLEQLSVESFVTERDGGAEKGTVRGHDSGSENATINCSGYPCGPTDSTNPVDPTWGSGDVNCVCQEMVSPA